MSAKGGMGRCEASKPNGLRCQWQAKTTIGWGHYCMIHAKQAISDPLAFHNANTKRKRGW